MTRRWMGWHPEYVSVVAARVGPHDVASRTYVTNACSNGGLQLMSIIYQRCDQGVVLGQQMASHVGLLVSTCARPLAGCLGV
jgi:hypothetical protein